LDQDKVQEACDIVIEAFGKSYALYGLPDVLGRIYGVLFFADEPLGLEDIARELQVSKATVSVNVRILESVNSVHKVWVKGSRRDYYEAERNVSKLMLESLRANMQREMDISAGAITRSKEILSKLADSPEAGERERASKHYNNLVKLEKQYDWSYQVLSDILNALEKPED
jgi:DNA-binding transcriptional regulator GbsR (MarR family)